MSKKKLLFELSIEDAAIIVSYTDQIIINGVNTDDAPAFKRLKKALQNPKSFN